ncbi:MAG: hypothetical protein WBB85_16985 [Albidovulum sp.]|uniref:hypothetical protein n=1 Tax=Albidovulum sp. TaxID=1872424 RepID=UPI003C9759D7
MTKAIFLAVLVAAMPAIGAAETAQSGFGTETGIHELSRVDPGKTLKLIKRIKDAGGSHIAS